MSINVMTLGVRSLRGEPVYIPALQCVGYISGRDGQFCLHVREHGPLREGEYEDGLSGPLWKCHPFRRNQVEQGLVTKVNGLCISALADVPACMM